MQQGAGQDGELWQQPVFVGLFASTLFLALGSQIYQLALPLILYELTHSLNAMSQLRAVEFLPNLLLAVFIGVWVDRVCRRRWAQRSLLAMALLLGVAGILLAQGWLPVWLFYPLAFVMMLCNYITAICRFGLVKHSVPQPLLIPATSYLNTLFNLFAVTGPMLSGLLIAFASLAWGMWLPALLFVLSSLALLRVPAMPPQATSVRHFGAELAAGWGGCVPTARCGSWPGRWCWLTEPAAWLRSCSCFVCVTALGWVRHNWACCTVWLEWAALRRACA